MIFEWIGYIIVCWLAADLLAGFWHWAEDRYFQEDWPIVGKWIAKPNQLHHAEPQAFLSNSYWSRNSTTIIPASIAFLLTLHHPVCLVFLFVSQANEIHAWAHSKGKLSAWVEMLQKTELLQSPRQHALHHTDPHDTNYCVMTGWLNPVLDYVGFWLILEAILDRAGIHVRDEATA